MERKNRLSPITIVLHWLIGLTIIALWGIGFTMKHWHIRELYAYHKSIGVIVLIAIIIRVLWRFKKGWPVPVSNYKKWEHRISKLVHWVLLITSLTLPLFGMMLSIESGHGINVFGLIIIEPHFMAGKIVHYSTFWSGIAREGHNLSAYILLGALVLHVVGAFKHHLIDQDGTLKRMLGHSINT
ncbi:MAG: Cytochrome b561 [Candidatus Celerinatantimonas neptuna]|nr:MAG: Cytochrome b561 [Candidatus Celerinatantimonas neptuna]